MDDTTSLEDVAAHEAELEHAKQRSERYSAYLNAKDAYERHLRPDPDALAHTEEARTLAVAVDQAWRAYVKFVYGW